MINLDSSPLTEQIRYYLANKGTRINWVADQITLSKSYLTHILKGRRRLTPEILQKINNCLGTDFKDSQAETGTS